MKSSIFTVMVTCISLQVIPGRTPKEKCIQVRLQPNDGPTQKLGSCFPEGAFTVYAEPGQYTIGEEYQLSVSVEAKS